LPVRYECEEKKKEKQRKTLSDLNISEHLYLPIENDRADGLCMGNVVGSITVHSYQTCDDEQQRQK
jgi:hypothetical protein